MLRKLLIYMIPLFAASAPAIAENLRFNCHFTYACVETGDCGGADFLLEFTFDTITKDAFVVGNSGTSQVLALEGRSAITFLEGLVSGAVQSTTITDSGQSVHSRHSVIAGVITNSQYIGNCSG